MPSSITLRQFRYFIPVAAAARMLNIAQSALAKRMQELEEQLGQRLFEHSSKGMSLAAPGHRFLAGSRKVIGAVADATRLHRADGSQPLQGLLAIGVTSLVVRYDLSELLARYRRNVPAACSCW